MKRLALSGVKDALTKSVTFRMDGGQKTATRAPRAAPKAEAMPPDKNPLWYNKKAEAMPPDKDPLWYDKAEADEPLNIYTIVLLGAFVLVEFFCVGIAEAYRALKGGAVLAFRSARS